MRTLRKILLGLFLSLAILQNQSKAVDFTWTEGDYNLPLPDYMSISTLNISNDVTVTMSGGGVNHFYMHDNSSLIINTIDSSTINNLYLYDNSSAAFSRGNIFYFYIDPSSTALVKIYGSLDESGSSPSLFVPSYGQGHMHGFWTAGGYFDIDLHGSGAYSHIQFIPEPTTIALFGIGILALRRRK